MKETNESLQGVNREINLDIWKFTLLLDCLIYKIMRRKRNSFCIEIWHKRKDETKNENKDN